MFRSRLADVTIPTGTLPDYVLRRAPGLGAKAAVVDAADGTTIGYVAPCKKLRAIEAVAQIPRSATGKILRRVLKERQAG